jgi:hypothetical protein
MRQSVNRQCGGVGCGGEGSCTPRFRAHGRGRLPTSTYFRFRESLEELWGEPHCVPHRDDVSFGYFVGGHRLQSNFNPRFQSAASNMQWTALLHHNVHVLHVLYTLLGPTWDRRCVLPKTGKENGAKQPLGAVVCAPRRCILKEKLGAGFQSGCGNKSCHFSVGGKSWCWQTCDHALNIESCVERKVPAFGCGGTHVVYRKVPMRSAQTLRLLGCPSFIL